MSEQFDPERESRRIDHDLQSLKFVQYAQQQPVEVDPETKKPSFVALGVLVSAGVVLTIAAIHKGREIIEQQPVESIDATAEPLLELEPRRETGSSEFEIDFHEIATANAGMLDVSLERINEDGALVPLQPGAGGLLSKNGGLYFATAAPVLVSGQEKPDQHVARFTVPVGAGSDPLQYVIPLGNFEPFAENPDILAAQFLGRDDGTLYAAIEQGRITPLELTALHGNIGSTVIGAAVHESPYLNSETGKVLTRNIRPLLEHSGQVAFSSDESSCFTDIRVGQFVLNKAKHGRLAPETFGVIDQVLTQPDPHHEGSCFTGGVMAVNAQISNF